jgi:hypothetical protein
MMKLRWLVTERKDRPVLQYWDEYESWWVDVPFVVEI